MILTNKQEIGLKECVTRYNNHEPWTCIAGYAGTGKSTLVKFIIAALNLNPELDVCYVTYTGKASLVLKQKGCPNAMTAHRLLYKSYRRKDGTYFHMPKRPIDPYKLIIVDEVSMLPKEMWDLLLSHKIPVIALGDPGQLPPIGDDNGILQTPHVFLDEVMRQAQESEIIRLTMDIRNDKPLSFYKGEEVQVLPASEAVDGMFEWADQIICAKNATRQSLNQMARKYFYDIDSEEPIKGDKIICLRNDWNIMNPNGDVLVNGLIGYVEDFKLNQNVPYLGTQMICDFTTDLEDETGLCSFEEVDMDYQLFMTGEPLINKNTYSKIPRNLHPKQFDYGYAITGWKAQGSEYDNVLVFQESFPWEKEMRKKFIYTCATRASKKLIIIKDWS